MMPTSRKNKKAGRQRRPDATSRRAHPRVANPPPDTPKNAAPTQWGRRLARLVGEKYGVAMDANWSKNEGIFQGRDIAIKCAKSPMPPVTVLIDMLERIDHLWAVFVMFDGSAEIWEIDAARVREHGYFTHGLKVQKRVEIYRRKIVKLGTLLGTLSVDEVASCHIP